MFHRKKLIVAQRAKELSAFLWNPKIHYCDQITPPLDPILSQLHPGIEKER
jgi:hypothetical protein